MQLCNPHSGFTMKNTLKTPTTTENLEERQGDLDVMRTQCEAISDDLSCAETCETPADFDANLDNAIATVEALLKALKEVRS